MQRTNSKLWVTILDLHVTSHKRSDAINDGHLPFISLSLSLSLICIRTESVCSFSMKIIRLLHVQDVHDCWFLREGEIVLSLCTCVKMEILLLVKNKEEVLT